MKKSFKLVFGSFVVFSLIACGSSNSSSIDSKLESKEPSIQESITPPSSEVSLPSSSLLPSSSPIPSSKESSSIASSVVSSSVTPIEQSSSSPSISSSITSSIEEQSSSIPTPTSYHVIFQNDDETVLLEIDVLEGNEAIYSGETPTKEEDDEFTYEFIGWDKEEDLKAVSSNVTTKAVYKANAKENWGPIIWF